MTGAPIYFFNTLSRAKEQFTSLHTNHVGMYACGPTVYDYAHIGNLRTYIFEDMVRRVLEQSGYRVTHAMNVTDVGHLVGDGDAGEDKLEVGAKREGLHPLEIAQKYERAFFADLGELNILIPQHIKRATDAIQEQINLIQELEAKGFTYRTDSAIYFDTSRLADYGKLTGQALEDKRAGAREEVVVDPEKRNATDFALWFFLTGRYAQHILHWPSPWGDGFPGWHVECSAIARELLGQPFDIHMGGVDHIGTHHTNEIAQSEAAYDAPLAKYWLHGEFLLVDGRRMGKSEGNLLTLELLKSKGYDPLAFRYLVLMAHYRSKMNFTFEALDSAARTLAGVQRLVREAREATYDQVLYDQVIAALRDDLNTPQALALLHEAKSGALWRAVDPVLGLGLADLADAEDDIPQEVIDLLEKRSAARKSQDWQTADAYRAKIEALGYQVLDTPEGARAVKQT